MSCAPIAGSSGRTATSLIPGVPLMSVTQPTKRTEFLKYDGSGRKPRGVQVDFLTWLSANWEAPILAGQLPVG